MFRTYTRRSDRIIYDYNDDDNDDDNNDIAIRLHREEQIKTIGLALFGAANIIFTNYIIAKIMGDKPLHLPYLAITGATLSIAIVRSSEKNVIWTATTSIIACGITGSMVDILFMR